MACDEVRGNFERDLALVHLNAASKSGEFDALVRQIAAGVAVDRRQQRKALCVFEEAPRLGGLRPQGAGGGKALRE